ncbi:MAG: TonB-dependent receptor domain-containing protein [Sphingomicrobium sp.]
MLHLRPRLLATTLMVGTGLLASPAAAQTAPSPANPADTANGQAPETTAPVEGTTAPSTNAQGAPVSSGGDIVITGSRIPQHNLTSASPVTVLSSQDIKLQGTTRTEDLINSLPQSFAAQGSTVSNGATGTAEANLRGIGAARTMVLINGRRLQPGDPRQPTSDINFIPASLIKRVDVLTGGASSVYGADAVAGVVNFIMDTNFRGLRFDGQASFFMHNNNASDKIIRPNEDLGFRPPHGQSINGGAQDLSVAFGAGFDDNRGSIMAYATYRKQDSVLQSTRDYSFCAMGTNPDEDDPFYCGGSTTSREGRVRVFDPATGARLVNAHFDAPNARIVAGVPLFNFAPYNYYQRPDERYTFGAFAEYEISPGAKPYVEAMFMNDHSDAQIAPSGNFNNSTYLNCDNPLLNTAPGSGLGGLSMQQTICQPGFLNTDPGLRPVNPVTGLPSDTAFVLIGRRNVEGGGRDDDLEHTSWRIVGGVRGDVLPGVSYDAYYQFGTTRLSETYFNDFSVQRIQRAIDVIDADPGPGVTPVCRSTLNGQDPNCVPWDIFGPGGVSAAALNYLQTPGFQRGHVDETVANANVTIDGSEYGIQTPWSDRGMALNVGAEYRKESLDFNTDVEFQTGDLAGQGGPTLPNAGSFDVREAFAEVQIPVINHSFIDEFTITGGYRYSDYKVNDNHFSTDAYKISAELAPIRDIRARASYNRAVRAPNIVELFGPQGLGLAGGVDLCAAGTGTNGPATQQTALTTAQCLNTFATQIANGNFTVATATAAIQAGLDPNPAFQYNVLLGGNVNLTPETADTYTAGVVLQPRWIPGLAVTVDYFDIKVKNLITTFPFTGLIAACGATGDPTFCNLINRDVTGSLFNLATGFANTTNLNLGSLRTKGVDVNASYSHRIGGMGTLNASLVGTYLQTLKFNTGLSPAAIDPTLDPSLNGTYECAGRYGATCSNTVAGVPSPKWRHKFRLGFTLPNGLGISGQWRYFSSVKNDTLSDDQDLNFLTGSHANPGDAKLNAQSFFDLALTARLADRYNFRLGANNILDKDPPVSGGAALGGFSNGNTYPQVYDANGRYVFAGVTIDF